MDSGEITLKDETTGDEIPLVCSFTERQKAILKQVDCLNIPKRKADIKWRSALRRRLKQFRTLLNEQIARERKMEQDKRYTDYKKLDKIIIGICGGDGIGPIISAESERLLQFILKDEIAAGKIELAHH